MSILLPRYSGFPPEIFERGLVPRMSDSALRLYLFLCRTSDRKSRLQFVATDKEIGEQTGASSRSLRDARVNLIKLCLIACERAPGGTYAYSLCDLATGKPFPGDPKMKARYVKKDGKAKRESHVPTPSPPPPPFVPLPSAPLPPPPVRIEWHSKSVQEDENEDTSFAYGHNPPPLERVYFPLNAYADPR